MARPRKELTPEDIEAVEKLAPLLTQMQIADYLGMSDTTLRKRMYENTDVAAAYARGRARAVAGVAANLVQQARGGNMQAAIFYLKSQAGWKETQVQEHTGELPVLVVTRESAS
jgi:hypothetical protein